MNKYKKLKEAILSISDSKRQSISKAERESYSVFIEMSLACAVMSILQKYKNKGYSDKELQKILILGKPLITENYNFRLNAERLEFIDEAFRIYAEIVKESEPFTDVLSILHEEILLTGGRGEGLGQFFTPPDLARSLALMLFNETTEYPSGIISIGEPCCGAGSLALSPLQTLYKAHPERLRDVHLFLNDLDTLAVKSAVLQVLMTCLYHDVELGKLEVFNANILTEYLKGNTFLLSFETPTEKPEAYRAFEEMMKLVMSVEDELVPA